MRMTPSLDEEDEDLGPEFAELIERVRQWSSIDVSDAEIQKAAIDILKLNDNDWLVFEGANLEILIEALELQAAQAASECNAAQPPRRSVPGQLSQRKDRRQSQGPSTGPPGGRPPSSTDHFSTVTVSREEAAEPASKQAGKGAARCSQYLGNSEDDEEAEIPLLRRSKLRGNSLLVNQSYAGNGVNQRQATEAVEATSSHPLQGKRVLESFPAAPPNGLDAYLLPSGTAGGLQDDGVTNLEEESSRSDLPRARHSVLLKRKKRDNQKSLSELYSHEKGAVAQPPSQGPRFEAPNGTAILGLGAANNMQPDDDDFQNKTVWVEVPEDQGLDVGTPKLARFACSAEGCNKEFPDVGALRKHAHVHAQKQQHVCDFDGCGKEFINSSKLKRHQPCHSGEKPFVCPFEGCGKAFSLDFNLRSHMRIHTGEKYHDCPVQACGKRFAHNYKLQAHLKTHQSQPQGATELADDFEEEPLELPTVALPPLDSHAGTISWVEVADQKPDSEPAPANDHLENESPKRSLHSGPGRPGVRKGRRKTEEAVGAGQKRRSKLPIRRAELTGEGDTHEGRLCAGNGSCGLTHHLESSSSEQETEKGVKCKAAEKKGSHKGKKTDIERPRPLLKTCRSLPGGGTGLQAPSPSSEPRIFCKQGGIIVSRDISDGRERLPISCVNEINGRTDLTEVKDFRYNTTSRIASTGGAESSAICSVVDFSLDRLESPCECNGDCLSEDVPCVCASTTRGKYAYDKNGCLIEEYRINYVECPAESKDFIRECSDKCSCSYGACGNRVVQRGITVPLQVFMTKRKGWGVRPLTDVPAGHFLYEYIGEICTNKDCMQRERKYAAATSHIFTMSLDADYDMEELHFNGGLTDNEALTLDATKRGNVSRFMNHSCDNCNVLFRPVQVDVHDTHYYRVAFFTSRNVKALEELTWDYGCQFDGGAQSIAEFSCCCESPNCRDLKKSAR